MANTSLDQFIDTLHGTLGFADNTGSVNLYMAHGGTNFGFTAGASWLHAQCLLLNADDYLLLSSSLCNGGHA